VAPSLNTSFNLDQFLVNEGNQPVGTYGFYLRRDGDLSAVSTLRWETTQTYLSSIANATLGTDLPYSTGSITFAPGASFAQLIVPVTGDTLFEPDEVFNLRLYDFFNLSDTGSVFIPVKIINDDSSTNPSYLSVASYSPFAEGSAGETSFAEITLIRSQGNLSEPASFYYGNTYYSPSLSGRRATISEDFSAVNYEQVVFAPNQTNASIRIPILGDNQVEGDEVFTLEFKNPTNLLFYGASVEPWHHIITIKEDDFIHYPTAVYPNQVSIPSISPIVTVETALTNDVSVQTTSVIQPPYSTNSSQDNQTSTPSIDPVPADLTALTSLANTQTIPTTQAQSVSKLLGLDMAFVDANKIQIDNPLSISSYSYGVAFVGTDQADVVTGSIENEIIFGGGGSDKLTGGQGADVFLFETPYDFGSKNLDILTDFNPMEGDKLLLSESVFGNIETISLRYASGSKGVKRAASSTKPFVYDNKNGILYFNENGKKAGWGAGGEFLRLLGAPEIVSTDLVLL